MDNDERFMHCLEYKSNRPDPCAEMTFVVAKDTEHQDGGLITSGGGPGRFDAAVASAIAAIVKG